MRVEHESRIRKRFGGTRIDMNLGGGRHWCVESRRASADGDVTNLGMRHAERLYGVQEGIGWRRWVLEGSAAAVRAEEYV
jgi:hypothetical protein